MRPQRTEHQIDRGSDELPYRIIFALVALQTLACGQTAFFPFRFPPVDSSQTKESAHEEAPDGPGASTEATGAAPREWFRGDLPWWEWSRMTGDWNRWRTRGEERGITVGGFYTVDTSKIMSGGLRRNTVTRSLLDVNVTLDLDQLLSIPNGTAYFEYYSVVGQSGTESVGDYQFFSNIDLLENRHQVAEVWYNQLLFDERVRFKLGKVDANTEFAFNANAADFTHSGMGFPLAILAFPTFPEPAVSANLFVLPAPFVSVAGGIYDGAAQDGTKTGKHGIQTALDDPSDLFLIGELRIYWEFLGRVGELAAGAWRHTGKFERFSGGTRSGTDGLYVVLDQALWLELIPAEGEPLGPADQGVFVAASFSDGDPSVNPLKRHLMAGLEWRGAIPTRDADVIGVGFSRAEFTDRAGSPFDENSEVAYEAFYLAKVTPWLAIQPTYQYIADPGGQKSIDDASIFSVRVNFDF